MSEFNHRAQAGEPAVPSSADALDSLTPFPEGELQFTDGDGKPTVHIRRLIAVPSGDEMYTDKPAVVFAEEMRPPQSTDATRAKIYFRKRLFAALIKKNQEGEE